MMWFIFESALVNAWVLYKATRTAAGPPVEYTHLEFHIAIARALAAEWEGQGCVNQTGFLQSPFIIYQSTSKKGSEVLVKHLKPL